MTNTVTREARDTKSFRRRSRQNICLLNEAVSDGDYFPRHPQLGAAGSLPSVQAFARVLDECVRKLPLDDTTVSNEALVEQDPHWVRIRNAAKAVLEELGADLDQWEREELGSEDLHDDSS
jgi:hypothetical protein